MVQTVKRGGVLLLPGMSIAYKPLPLPHTNKGPHLIPRPSATTTLRLPHLAFPTLPTPHAHTFQGTRTCGT